MKENITDYLLECGWSVVDLEEETFKFEDYLLYVDNSKNPPKFTVKHIDGDIICSNVDKESALNLAKSIPNLLSTIERINSNPRYL